MALRLHIASVSGTGDKGDKFVRVTFRGVSFMTRVNSSPSMGISHLQPHHEADRSCSTSIVIDETFHWPVGSPIAASEQVRIQLLSHSRYLSNKILGTFGLVLQQVVDQGSIKVEDCFTDANNAPLAAKVAFEVFYVSPARAVPDDDSEDYQLVTRRVQMSPLASPRRGQLSRGSLGHHDQRETTATSFGDLVRSIESLADGAAASSDLETQQLCPKSSKKRPSPDSPRKSRSSLGNTARSLATFMKIGTRKSQELQDNQERAALSKAAAAQATNLIDSDFGSCGDVYLGLEADELRSGSPNMLLMSRERESAMSLSGLTRRASEVAAPYSITTPVLVKKLDDVQKEVLLSTMRPQDYQVCVTVIEARHLAGLNMDPVVCVQVGDSKKYTSVKESTNCPYYNEYFVFDFHMAPSMLFDKMIVVTVLHSRNLLRSGKVIGSFKLDVGTVWSQVDHQFYHKWALLTDPDDVFSGAKGYVKADILVAGKGDPVKPPPTKPDTDDDDIEGNLLLPRGVPCERQHARFIVRVYRADGLPRTNTGLMSNVRKAFASGSQHLIDPYVVVTFAGLSGKTTVRKSCCNPVFNEQITFTELFPPLCQRIKIQVRDSDAVNDNVIATHFIHLSKISNEGDKGFLPTYGPAFVYLYGSPRDSSILFNMDQISLNDGFAEGVSYRGRILISIKTQILDSIENNLADVVVEPIAPINESTFGRNEDFLVFASIFESNMIDRRFAEKQITYELTIGNEGCSDDVVEQSQSQDSSDNSPCSPERSLLGTSRKASAVSIPSPSAFNLMSSYEIRSTTNPMRPMLSDRQYYFLPIESEKPCMYLKTNWPDHRRRLYQANVVSRIAEATEVGLADVEEMVRLERSHADRRFRGVLEELAAGCSKFAALARASGVDKYRTKLDKERTKLIQRELDHIASQAKSMKPLVVSSNIREKIKIANQLLAKIRELTDEVQPGLPDMFIWMIASGKRIAYAKLSAKNYIYSSIDEEAGKLCGKVHSLFFKLPGSGRRSDSSDSWLIQNKLQAYVWLGLNKSKKNFPKGLPKGYRACEEIRSADKVALMPPISLFYEEKHTFELRAHMYQARSLIASDSSGLSDPFAKVIFADVVQTTQVIEETLSPTWDEMLLFAEVTLYGSRVDLLSEPPTVVIEIYDQDKVGKAEFIGRAFARTYIRFSDQLYACPQLQWFDIRRGDEQAGQLLAAFELVQLKVSETGTPAYPGFMPEIKAISGRGELGRSCPIYPVPQPIRPTLSKYRIEVLFWGLRDLKKIHFMSVDRPRVDVECSGHILSSSVILNYKRNPNFQIPVKHMDLELPDQELYCPPLTIRVMDCRSFGRFTLVGTHVIASLSRYMWREQSLLAEIQAIAQKFQEVFVEPRNVLPAKYFIVNRVKMSGSKRKRSKPHFLSRELESMDFAPMPSGVDDDDDAVDWWSRYFASVDAMISEKAALTYELIAQSQAAAASPNFVGGSNCSPSSSDRMPKKRSPKSPGHSPRVCPKSNLSANKSLSRDMLIKIFPCELEAEYNGFTEWLNSFELYRGKRTSSEDELKNLVGYFKGSIQLYKHPLPGRCPIFDGLPSNDPIHVMVRVYVVKGNDLHPMDLNGKADPYVTILLGSKRVSDKENYISKQLNPIFGKCFEFEATFPQDSLLTMQIYDWDLFGSDDLIGETKIDLENRYYSHHRATCGLSRVYETSGPTTWRDAQKPSIILSKLCKDLKVSPPVFYRNRAKVGNVTFNFNSLPTNCDSSSAVSLTEEQLALGVLNNWTDAFGYNLIPEHIETRALYHPDKPGIEQGTLEMWIDMFPLDSPVQPPPPIDISPRKPKSYELRLTVWNTDEVVLEDDAFFTGEKMSDIYVKGWLKGSEDCQCTDIHYRSLTGEGNFNWRFIFPFDYLPAEEKIVISRKESLFSWDESESKIPARLQLQVWDADHFSSDDFLGAITLDLNRFPRGAKTAKLCNLSMLNNCNSSDAIPTVSLFKQKRIKGWWPFYIKKENDEMELTGKVEAELQLLTKEEAERQPAGMGRSEPDPLEKPNRPDSSFIWVLNPLKSIRYILWHNYKWVLIKGILFFLTVLFILLFVYSLPGYSVKRILGA